jgi:hypothetical protein
MISWSTHKWVCENMDTIKSRVALLILAVAAVFCYPGFLYSQDNEIEPAEEDWIEIAVFVHGITPNRGAVSSEKYYDGLNVNLENYYNLLKSPEDADYPFDDDHRIYVHYGLMLPNTSKVASISDDLVEAQSIIADLDRKAWNSAQDNSESFYRSKVITGARDLILYGMSDAVYYMSDEGTREIRGSIINQVFRALQQRGYIINDGSSIGGKKMSFTIFAHSLGTLVMYDILNSIFTDHEEDAEGVYTEFGSEMIVAGLKVLKQNNRIRIRKLYSFGSQMSLMHLRKENSISETLNNRWNDVSNLFHNDDGLPDPRWINYWDKDDVLGYPIEFLYTPRAETGEKIVRDVHVDVNDYAPHEFYWFSEEMAFDISADFLGLPRAVALEKLEK